MYDTPAYVTNPFSKSQDGGETVLWAALAEKAYAEVFGDLLDVDPDRLAALRAAGVI